mmetsp:Transcript_12264/g.49225  ORF Transcript_12264/g.49225 Transcript_12264/m.49225 type:complete len:305 (+) Transcript_12264:699-1613(+)
MVDEHAGRDVGDPVEGRGGVSEYLLGDLLEKAESERVGEPWHGVAGSCVASEAPYNGRVDDDEAEVLWKGSVLDGRRDGGNVSFVEVAMEDAIPLGEDDRSLVAQARGRTTVALYLLGDLEQADVRNLELVGDLKRREEGDDERMGAAHSRPLWNVAEEHHTHATREFLVLHGLDVFREGADGAYEVLPPPSARACCVLRLEPHAVSPHVDDLLESLSVCSAASILCLLSLHEGAAERHRRSERLVDCNGHSDDLPIHGNCVARSTVLVDVHATKVDSPRCSKDHRLVLQILGELFSEQSQRLR